jgi:hypothetical protein
MKCIECGVTYGSHLPDCRIQQIASATQWWVGREVICEPVTGDVWHKVVSAVCLGVYGPTVLVLDGGIE